MRNQMQQLSLKGADFVQTFDLRDKETIKITASKSLIQYTVSSNVKGLIDS